DVLVILAVILAGRDVHDFRGASRIAQHRKLLGDAYGALGQITDRDAVGGVADVEDATGGTAAVVLEDRQQTLDGVVDVGEGSLLAAAVDQLYRALVEHVGEELREYARAALLRLLDVVEIGPDEIEGPEQGVVEIVAHPVGVDDAIQQLLGGGVDPALLVDRSVDQRAGLLIEYRIRGHAVDLGRGREDQALAVLDAVTHDVNVGFEVEFEHAQRMRDVLRRIGDRHQWHNHVAFLDVVLHPLLVDGDVALDEVETLVLRQLAQLVVGKVDAVHLPVAVTQDRAGEPAADEAVRAENHDLQCHIPYLPRPSARRRRPRAAWTKPVILTFSGPLRPAPPSAAAADAAPLALLLLQVEIAGRERRHVRMPTPVPRPVTLVGIIAAERAQPAP